MKNNPSQEDLQKLWDTCSQWVQTAQPLCEESIYQSDSVQEALYDLGTNVCKVVGFFEDLEEES